MIANLEKNVLSVKRTTGRISLNWTPLQRSRERLDTLCHEVIHLLGPHLAEETVISHANVLSDALWRDRWRRIES